jgi:hypothetical protein
MRTPQVAWFYSAVWLDFTPPLTAAPETGSTRANLASSGEAFSRGAIDPEAKAFRRQP